ncbi:hypothetical protein BJ508DRAFT_411208 [Ascobolus immersus RN42]|uniref:Uncharacterized protein n=1 Tax=Ascobolus immersus RN42 TaxID=1160509 RepID=A0A3N4IM74_ASCIM|nr:hypothetical protein BJ508DRAFT_411208 [Ascobolus immersus RN42]
MTQLSKRRGSQSFPPTKRHKSSSQKKPRSSFIHPASLLPPDSPLLDCISNSALRRTRGKAQRSDDRSHKDSGRERIVGVFEHHEVESLEAELDRVKKALENERRILASAPFGSGLRFDDSRLLGQFASFVDSVTSTALSQPAQSSRPRNKASAPAANTASATILPAPSATVSAAQQRPPVGLSAFSHIPTPTIPRKGEDIFQLYIIFQTTTGRWNPQAVRVRTLKTCLLADKSPEGTRMDSRAILDRFMDLPADATEYWEAFVREIEGRKEMEGMVLVMEDLEVEMLKIVVRVASVEVSG